MTSINIRAINNVLVEKTWHRRHHMYRTHISLRPHATLRNPCDLYVGVSFGVSSSAVGGRSLGTSRRVMERSLQPAGPVQLTASCGDTWQDPWAAGRRRGRVAVTARRPRLPAGTGARRNSDWRTAAAGGLAPLSTDVQ